MNLEKFGVTELSTVEKQKTDGGRDKYGYYSLTWSGTNNPIEYAVEAGINLGKILINGCAWIGNQQP